MSLISKEPDIRNLTITDLGFGGDGIAHVEGETIFVPYALPGDTVRVRVAENQKQERRPGGSRDLETSRDSGFRRNDTSNKRWAQIIDVINPSPDRVSRPPCAHCFDCGGCALQHMSMTAYQAWKYQGVIERLNRAGLNPETIYPLIAVPPKTRRRAVFCAQREKGRVKVGFNRHHSDQVVDLAECHVVIDPILELLPALRVLMDVMLDQAKQADVGVTALDTGLDVLITGDIALNLIKREALAEFAASHNIARISLRAGERDEAEVILQPKPAQITVGGVTMTPAPGSFLQPSREGEVALVAGVTAGVGGAEHIADLFSGLGTFTFPLAARGAQVTGFDADGPGIRAAASAHVLNAIFQARNLYRDPLSAQELSAFGAVVFDPPRAGAKAQAPEIAASRVPRVVAVSCNPATFANDAGLLVQGGYRFLSLSIIDQFTWSSHVEIVGVFEFGHRAT